MWPWMFVRTLSVDGTSTSTALCVTRMKKTRQEHVGVSVLMNTLQWRGYKLFTESKNFRKSSMVQQRFYLWFRSSYSITLAQKYLHQLNSRCFTDFTFWKRRESQYQYKHTEQTVLLAWLTSCPVLLCKLSPCCCWEEPPWSLHCSFVCRSQDEPTGDTPTHTQNANN